MFVVVEATLARWGASELCDCARAQSRGARAPRSTMRAAPEHRFQRRLKQSLLIHPERCEDETYRYRIDGGGAGSDLQQP
jgi:hypothetical protein